MAGARRPPDAGQSGRQVRRCLPVPAAAVGLDAAHVRRDTGLTSPSAQDRSGSGSRAACSGSTRSSGKLQGTPIETPFTATLPTFGDGSVYLGDNGSGQIAKIDPSSNGVIWKTRLHPWLPSMLAAGGYLWVTVDLDAGVHKFDERTGRELGRVQHRAGPDTLTYDGDQIWVNNWRADTVTSIDPVSGNDSQPPPAGHPTGPMAISHGQVAAPTQGAAKNLSTIKGDVLRVVQREDWTDSFDPARSWEAKHWQRGLRGGGEAVQLPRSRRHSRGQRAHPRSSRKACRRSPTAVASTRSRYGTASDSHLPRTRRSPRPRSSTASSEPCPATERRPPSFFPRSWAPAPFRYGGPSM